MMTLLTAAALAMTVPLFGLVRKDLAQRRTDEIRAVSLFSPKGFSGMTVEGGRFTLPDRPESTFVALFVLHRETLPHEVAVWGALQGALAPAAVVLVGTCEDAACVARLRRGDVSPRFTVLSSVAFAHGRTLARLDAGHHWLLCDASGRVKGRYPIPRDAAEVAELARLVLKPAEGDSHAQARS